MDVEHLPSLIWYDACSMEAFDLLAHCGSREFPAHLFVRARNSWTSSGVTWQPRAWYLTNGGFVVDLYSRWERVTMGRDAETLWRAWLSFWFLDDKVSDILVHCGRSDISPSWAHRHFGHADHLIPCDNSSHYPRIARYNSRSSRFWKAPECPECVEAARDRALLEAQISRWIERVYLCIQEHMERLGCLAWPTRDEISRCTGVRHKRLTCALGRMGKSGLLARLHWDFVRPPPPCLRTMPYDEYLQTDHWKDVRTQALRRAGYRCQVCNDGGQLDVHHRTYERRGEEAPGDVTVLCRSCHSVFHDGGARMPVAQ